MSMGDETDKPADEIDRVLPSAIGEQLRSMYDSVLSEPIPSRLIELLEKLDDVDAARGKSDSGDAE